MPRSWATVSDLIRFLGAGGMITVPPDTSDLMLDFQSALDAAQARIEQETGYQPFLADTADVTRYYDWPGGSWFQFPRGTVYFAVTTLTTDTANNNSGTVQTLHTDWEPDDPDAVPIRRIRLNSYRQAAPRDLKIVGKRGYTNDLPADMYTAHLQYAAFELWPQISALAQSGVGGAQEWREGDVSEKYGQDGAFSGQAQAWQAAAGRAVCRYRQPFVSLTP